MADDKIIDRIQKLLALTQSSNVNEAAAAMAAAQALMTKHELELADIEAATPGAHSDDTVDTDLFREKTFISWKYHLADHLARANGCRVYYTTMIQRASGKQVGVVTHYVGSAAGLATIKYMYAYLVREIDRLAGEARGPGVDRAYLRSFRLGASLAIGQRLLEASKQAKVGASGTALAVVDKKAERAQAVIDAKALKERGTTSVRDASAFSHGRQASESVNISTGPGLGRGSKGELPE